MMIAIPPNGLYSQGFSLDTSPESFGELSSSSHLQNDPEALRAKIEADGYLFLRDFFPRAEVLAVRHEVLCRMEKDGLLEPGTDPLAAIARVGRSMGFAAEYGKDNPLLEALLFEGRLIDFYRALFGETVRHFDYTWFRAVGPGFGTRPHCDVVYMGRGTRGRLCTAWVPQGDVPIHVGGLMLLEGSHRQSDRLQNYLNRDVDTYCANGRHAEAIESGSTSWEWDGSLSSNPATLREKLGGRWLTAEYRAGDLLTFRMQMVHASLDNASNQVRLSSDTRYQAASEPIDERWVGKTPIGHGPEGKKSRIC